MDKRAITALAYAIYDSVHSTRLSEDPEVLEEYEDKAYRLLYVMRYRTPQQRNKIAKEIRRCSS